MTMTGHTTSVGRSQRNDNFIAHVRRVAADAGSRARLRRSLRRGNAITDDVWWLLGAWLPADRDEALIMAHVAGWCAANHKTDPLMWRTLPGEIAAAGSRITEDAARRAIEGITTEGATVTVRLDRTNRIIEMLPDPVRVDWARLISDLVALLKGGERAHVARHRWYRDYFTIPSADQDNDSKEQQQ